MKNQNIYASVAIVIITIGIGIWIGHLPVKAPNTGTTATTTAATAADTGDKTYALACDSNKSLSLTFHLPGDATIDIVTDDGRDFTLNNTSTDSTASYSSPDGKTILALAGSTISLLENGKATYQNCALMPVAGMNGTTQ